MSIKLAEIWKNCIQSNIKTFQTCCWVKENRHKKIHTEWFHLYKKLKTGNSTARKAWQERFLSPILFWNKSLKLLDTGQKILLPFRALVKTFPLRHWNCWRKKTENAFYPWERRKINSMLTPRGGGEQKPWDSLPTRIQGHSVYLRWRPNQNSRGCLCLPAYTTTIAAPSDKRLLFGKGQRGEERPVLRHKFKRKT